MVRRRARAPFFAPSTPLSCTRTRSAVIVCPCTQRGTTRCFPLPRCCTIAGMTATSTRKDSISEPLPLPNRDATNEALELLEWRELSLLVAKLTRTDGGRALIEDGLELGYDRTRSETLLGETREMFQLTHVLARDVPLGGARQVSGYALDASKGLVLTGHSLRSIASTLEAARSTRRLFESVDGEHASFPLLLQHARAARTWPDVEAAIVNAIDEFGDVSDAAIPALAAVRNERREIVVAIRDALRALMDRHSDAIQERAITTRYNRFVILAKIGRKAVFRGAVVHDVSATGGTAYIEPREVRALNDRLRSAEAREKKIVQQVLRDLSFDHVAPIVDDIVELCKALAAIDAAGARAQVAAELNAVDVRFADVDKEMAVRLRGVRHPLLAWSANDDSDGDSVVPSDYIIPHGVRCVCITGPNTGGKTVALKTIGLAALMAKAGLFVLASPPEPGNGDQVVLPYFDKVLVDIGDDQSLVQSLSTFSGHIQRIKRILNASTPQSLVLFDEIGSGTDPAEGAALGAAILRSLAVDKGAALTLATTHHGELKTLKYASDDTAHLFENACVEFDDVAMKPTYRLLWGIPGRSNALAIAERLGLKKQIISDARQLLLGGEGGTERVDFENMISSLERQRRDSDRDAQFAKDARNQAATLREEAEKRLKKLSDAEDALRSDQRAAVNEELLRAKKSIATVIRDLQRSGGSAQAAAAATDKLSRLEGHLRKDGVAGTTTLTGEMQKPVDAHIEIGVGDSVSVARLGAAFNEVVKVSGNDLVIAMGRMRAKIKRSEVSGIRRKTPSQSAAVIPKRVAKSAKRTTLLRTAANTVDVRGERVDAAEARLEQALARAFPVGALWIIHGHGTGRLRTGIRAFLRGHELVSAIRDGDNTEGGTGVTVVTLVS